MTTAINGSLPPAWEPILQRYAAPGQAAALIQDARRYLGRGSPERVSPVHFTDTLKNLIHAYIEEARHEDALIELSAAAVPESAPPAPPRASNAALSIGAAAAAVVGVALWRRHRD